MNALNGVAGGSGSSGPMRQQSASNLTLDKLVWFYLALQSLMGLAGNGAQVASFMEERHHHQVPQNCATAVQVEGTPELEPPAACTALRPADG